ncbi:MAG: aminotransferase class I/II-fold pyridoxal phosphate-dependent enzyme [Candidatus Eisenbacteria bacterium]|nr:aminotransferase class I/II-fold pyridoxal phosphate-dependent enzyme [Candidatus Latescibacterota bacterium]MBD3301127.1 aminotransferase class I/II-fold pyridoxal phosphate-dependent enzyme [Candidatus Eisenbacteria bacterium]
MKPSATVALNALSNHLIARGREIFKLGLGQSPFPVPEPVVAALRRHAPCKDYLPVKGLPELREAVADYHRRASGIDCRGEDVLIGPGSKELMFLLQIVYYGDLIVPSPAWVSYAPQARIVGRPVHFIHTTREANWRLGPEQLDALCREDPDRPRIVILNYPSNPTGGTYEEGELRAIAEVARRYRVVLLADEIYGELHHRGRHLSVARFYKEGTILSSGLSKWCGAGGWRLGTFTFPRDLRWLLDAMGAVASETYTSTSAPIQWAAVTAFTGGAEIHRYLIDARRVLQALGNRICDDLEGEGIDPLRPEGGFYLFPDFRRWREPLRARGIATSPFLCTRLLDETGVAILPGAEFGRPVEELTARVAYVDFDGGAALAAARALPAEAGIDETFLERHCGRMLDAIRRIGAWLEKGEEVKPTFAAERPAEPHRLDTSWRGIREKWASMWARPGRRSAR